MQLFVIVIIAKGTLKTKRAVSVWRRFAGRPANTQRSLDE